MKSIKKINQSYLTAIIKGLRGKKAFEFKKKKTIKFIHKCTQLNSRI